MKSVSLEKLLREREAMAQSRNKLEKQLIMHDGALQTLNQLIAMAEISAEEKPAMATIVNNGVFK